MGEDGLACLGNRGGVGISKAVAFLLGLTFAIALPLSSLPKPAGPVFGPSYVVADLETLQGQMIDGVVPQPYFVGAYVKGGDTTNFGTSQPCPLGSYRIDAGNPSFAASHLDYRWIHQYAEPQDLPPVVWDLAAPRGAVIVFPNIDHGPFPEEGVEYTVWGANSSTPLFPTEWTLGTLSAIYTKGWTDNPSCSGVESDDWAGEYTFGFNAFRYFAVYSSFSITIFNDPSHTSWEGAGDDHPQDGWQSNDMEIDGVASPLCSPGIPQAAAGPDQVVPVGTTVQFEGTGSTGNVSLYGWDTDGNSVIDLTGARPTKTYTSPFDGDITLTVVDRNGCSSTDRMHLSVVSNRAPVITSFSATPALEGDTVTFGAIASDPDGDPLMYAFDFDGDGTFDLNGTSETATHVFGDDFAGTAIVRVSDGKVAVDATTPVIVRNVAPSIIGGVTAFVAVDLTLRVAGEKWHDVRLDIVWNDAILATARVVRTPGSPDAQAATLSGERIQLLGAYRLVLYYTPADDPVNGQPNGANPAWVILRFADGSTARLHHTFNVRHPDTWTWTLDDFSALLIGHAIEFGGAAHDVGSDDLTFAWGFGDGTTVETTYFNNGVSPDPYPSPDANPLTASDAVAHAYGSAASYTVTLTVRDDDGGSVQQTLVILVG